MSSASSHRSLILISSFIYRRTEKSYLSYFCFYCLLWSTPSTTLIITFLFARSWWFFLLFVLFFPDTEYSPPIRLSFLFPLSGSVSLVPLTKLTIAFVRKETLLLLRSAAISFRRQTNTSILICHDKYTQERYPPELFCLVLIRMYSKILSYLHNTHFNPTTACLSSDEARRERLQDEETSD